MPISIPFEWVDSPSSVRLSFVLPSHKNLEISLTDWAVKVNAFPGFAMIDFFEQIDTEDKLTFRKLEKGSELVINLIKKIPSAWPRLQPEQPDKARREASFLELEEKRKAEIITRSEEKERQKKTSEKHQWRLDGERREEFENWKKSEKEIAERDLYDVQDWQGRGGFEQMEDGPNELSLPDGGESKVPELSVNKTLAAPPAIREISSNSIPMSFTARRVPGAPARNRSGREPPKPQEISRSPADSPIWLKEKGDSLASVGDLRGAYSAYSQVIGSCGSQKGKIPSDIAAKAYANRSVVSLMLGRISAALEDCHLGLALIRSSDPTELHLKVVLLSRAALCALYLGEIRKAENFLKDAVAFAQVCPLVHPKELEILISDRDSVSAAVSVVKLKRAADESIKAEKYDDAVRLYGEVLTGLHRRKEEAISTPFNESKTFENSVILANLSLAEIQRGNFSIADKLAQSAISGISTWSVPRSYPSLPDSLHGKLAAALIPPRVLEHAEFFERSSGEEWLMKQEGVSDPAQLPPVSKQWEWICESEGSWKAIRKRVSAEKLESMKVQLEVLQAAASFAARNGLVSPEAVAELRRALAETREKFPEISDAADAVEAFAKNLDCLRVGWVTPSAEKPPASNGSETEAPLSPQDSIRRIVAQIDSPVCPQGHLVISSAKRLVDKCLQRLAAIATKENRLIDASNWQDVRTAEIH